MLSSNFPLETAVRSLIVRLLAATWLAALVAPVSGAEIRHTKPAELGYTGFANVILEGKIETGDYDKLLKIIDEYCSNYQICEFGIYLASPGGNLIEAMKIGRLVRKLRLETHVSSDLPPPYRQKSEAILKDAKANYMCASACFFIFVAGIDRERDTFSPLLGIHRPYLSDVDLKRLSGNQVMASAGQMRTVVEDYLKEMGVPAKYAGLMFSIPKDQVRFIDEDDFKSDFEGYIPELRDWLDAKCNNLTDIEKVASKGIEGKKRRKEKLPEGDERMNRMLAKKFKQQGECERQAMSKLSADAWKQFHDH
jgi:hypothetical protein